MTMSINRKIEMFLRDTGMPPTVFGRRALGDPRFVFDLRMGRQPGSRVCGRAERFIRAWRDNGCPVYQGGPGGRRA